MPNTILHPILTKNLTLKQAQHKRNVVFNQLPPFNLLFGRVYVSWRVCEIMVPGFRTCFIAGMFPSMDLLGPDSPTKLPLFQVGPSNRLSGEN